MRLGYRHIDTAEMYDNEREVGEGLRASGVRRNDVFVTTKIWPSHFAPRELERAARDCLVRLRLSEVDLLLLHWPNPQVPLAETIGALCKVKRDGLARNIGVSNFTVALIDEAVRLRREPLVCDQVECHPYLDQSKVIAACRAHGMAVVAYSPIARGGDPQGQRVGPDRRGAWQDRGTDLAALSGAAEHRRHSAHQQARAAVGKRRGVRFCARATSEMAEIAALAQPRRPAWSIGPIRAACIGIDPPAVAGAEHDTSGVTVGAGPRG